jgi:NodT family efflux transporter outer membrane factor (OMF) lipoprotein
MICPSRPSLFPRCHQTTCPASPTIPAAGAQSFFLRQGRGCGAISTLPLVFALFILSGCAPDLGEMPKLQDAASLETVKSFNVVASQWPKQDWWKAYGDPQLDGLIEEALQDSPSLKVAAARVRAATAVSSIAEADLLPTVSASGDLTETEVSANSQGQFLRSTMPSGWHHAADIAAGLNYEIDFFGKNRAALAAATDAAEATQADEAAARLQLSCAVATVYANLLQLYTDKQLAEDAVRQRKDSAALVQQRFANHLENQGQLSRAEAQVWAALTQLDTVNRLIRLTQNELAALLGKGPDRGLAVVAPANRATLKPAGLPAQLSLDLIGRRPDIVAARKRAAAAAAVIDVANASFYPNINLVGAFGVQSLDAGYLLTASSEMGHFGPSVSLPIFDYGRLTGSYRKARADYDAAVGAYDMALTYALRDVADAYVNRRGVEDELSHARAMLVASEKAYAALKARYAAGITPYLDLLTAETALIEQRRMVADFETNAFAYDIALIRALGGGYAVAK